jgi:hypothetical protein
VAADGSKAAMTYEHGKEVSESSGQIDSNDEYLSICAEQHDVQQRENEMNGKGNFLIFTLEVLCYLF